MGWTYQNRDKGMSDLEFFEREFGEGVVDVASGFINPNHKFIAYRSKIKGNPVICIICLTNRLPSRTEYYNYGYKDMSEDMGPYVYDCPKRITDQLDEFDDWNSYSSQWRQKVAVLQERWYNKPKLTKDKVVTVTRDMEFTNGVTIKAGEQVTVRDGKRHWFNYNGWFLFALNKESLMDLKEA